MFSKLYQRLSHQYANIINIKQRGFVVESSRRLQILNRNIFKLKKLNDFFLINEIFCGFIYLILENLCMRPIYPPKLVALFLIHNSY